MSEGSLSPTSGVGGSKSIRLYRYSVKSAVQEPVAFSADRDQIFLHVVSEIASTLQVMNVQIRERSASLATPPIAIQDPTTEPRISLRAASNAGRFRANRVEHPHSAKPLGSEAGDELGIG